MNHFFCFPTCMPRLVLVAFVLSFGHSTHAAPTPLPAPTDVTAVPSSNLVTISWNAVPAAVKYKVKRSTDATKSFKEIATVLAPLVSYKDTGAKNGKTYYYVVQAASKSGGGANSTPPVAATPALLAPTNLTAKVESRTVTLDWNTVPGATGYKVFRSLAVGGPFSGGVSVTGNSYKDTGLINGTTYYYVVVALEGAGQSTPSAVLAATPRLATPVVTVVAGSNTVKLSWPAVSGAEKYKVRRSEVAGGPYVSLTTVAAPEYIDTSVSNGKTYFYVVSAIDGEDVTEEESAPSAEKMASPLLQAPTGLTGKPGNRHAMLSWNAVLGADEYKIKRSRTAGGPVADPYVSVGSSKTPSFTDSNLKNGTTYYYVVVAFDGAEASANSSEVAVTPQLLPPAGLKATADNGQILLEWSESSNAESYRVRRATTIGGTYQTVATTTETEFIDKSVQNGVQYFYMVSAAAGNEHSAESAIVSATPVLLPPKNLKATPGYRQVLLEWTEVPNADSYKVRRAETLAGPYKEVATVTETEFLDTGVKNGKTYFYIVVTVDANQQSEATVPVSSTPRLQPPDEVKATLANSRVTLTWEAVEGALSYKIRRSTVAGGPYESVGSTKGTTFTDSKIKSGVTYFYVIVAQDGSSVSADSKEVSTLPAAPAPNTAHKSLASPTHVSAFDSGKTVALQWQAVAGATRYVIERSEDGEPFVEVGTSAKSEWTDTRIRAGVEYSYVVSAIDAQGNRSEPSQEAVIVTKK